MSFDPNKSLPGPENILRKEFPNGITVLIRENPYSHAVAVKGSLLCGSFLEPAGKIGLTGFAAGCLTAGTESHNFMEISELLEGSGASLGFSSGPRTISFSGSCLSEDVPMLLGLLKEVLDEPVFPENYIGIFRQRVLAAYELHLNDPESMTDERLDALLFGDHPYGRPEYGSVETINGFTRKDLVEFHRQFFSPKGMVLVIVGGIRAEEVLDVCGNVFGTWTKAADKINLADYFPPLNFQKRAVSEHIEIPDKSEMSLVIGTLGPARKDPDFIPAVLGNSILGEFGMMGRIGQTVREENGLAYYASSSLHSLTYGGCWTVDAGINPVNAERAAELILAELRRFTSQKVTAEELDDVKSNYIGSLPLSLESNSGVASLLMNIETYQLGLDHVLRLSERVSAVTPEQILQTAQKWIDPDKMIRLTAGTAAK